MGNKSLISIIVPVYNVAPYLQQCVDSLLAQTYELVEIILVDDGSNDQSGVICDEYAAKDPRVRVIHQENQGVSAARNHGIDVATGEWITFVDADDWLNDDACEILMQQEAQNDALIFSFVKNYENREIANKPLYPQSVVMQSKEELEQLRIDVLNKQLDCNVLRLTFCKLIKREILQTNNIRFNRTIPLCEDLLFWFEAFQYIKKATYVNGFFYHYRQNNSSATYRFRSDVDVEQDRMLHELKCLIEQTEHPELYWQGYYLEVFYCMQRCITQGFYHADNVHKGYLHNTSCKQFFQKDPYKRALKKISFSQLTPNHKIKYLIIKCGMYGSVESARNLYGMLVGKTTQKGE